MIPADLQRVLLTGASRVLAAALARILVERGGRVSLAARDDKRRRRRAADIEREFAVRVDWARADLRDAAECRALADVAVDERTLHPARGDD